MSRVADHWCLISCTETFELKNMMSKQKPEQNPPPLVHWLVN